MNNSFETEGEKFLLKNTIFIARANETRTVNRSCLINSIFNQRKIKLNRQKKRRINLNCNFRIQSACMQKTAYASKIKKFHEYYV